MLENVLLFALDEAKEKMEEGAELVPFTTLVVKENLFIESHPGDSSEECYNLAQHTVEGARGADAYAFCYDGYVETDDGTKDVIIAEGGVPGAEDGYAVGYLYTVDDEGGYTFEEEAAYIGEGSRLYGEAQERGRLRRGRNRREVSDGSRRGPFDGNRRRRRINPPLRLNFCESLVQMHGALVSFRRNSHRNSGRNREGFCQVCMLGCPQNELGGSRRCVVQVMGNSFGLPEAGNLR